MPHSFYAIASGDDSIGGIIVLVIGGLFWLVKTIAAASQGAKPRTPVRPPARPTAPQQARSASTTTPRQRMTQTSASAPKGRPSQPRAAAPPPLPVPQSVKAVAARPAPAAATVAATPLTIARTLHPATLRTQYIITEIFKPPLALREEEKI